MSWSAWRLTGVVACVCCVGEFAVGSGAYGTATRCHGRRLGEEHMVSFGWVVPVGP